MAKIGPRGIVRALAGRAIRFAFQVRASRAAVQLSIGRNATLVRSFSRDEIRDAEDVFTLDAGTYKFAWTVLALAQGAEVVVTIDVDGEVRYRREITYSGSGDPPHAFGGLLIGEV